MTTQIQRCEIELETKVETNTASSVIGSTLHPVMSLSTNDRNVSFYMENPIDKIERKSTCLFLLSSASSSISWRFLLPREYPHLVWKALLVPV